VGKTTNKFSPEVRRVFEENFRSRRCRSGDASTAHGACSSHS
jgi:hypothetical protein